MLLYSLFIRINDLFTLTHFHLFQLDINSKYTYHVSTDLNTRLVMILVSLRAQTGLHCLIIQVLNTRV